MNPYQAYSAANDKVDEGNKPRLLLKIYESMLDKTDIIKVAIRNKDYKKKYDELTKLTTALEVLDSSLDRSRGGEIAKNLSDLYQYMVRQLLVVHTNNDFRILDECKGLLEQINEGFSGAYKKEMGKRPLEQGTSLDKAVFSQSASMA